MSKSIKMIDLQAEYQHFQPQLEKKIINVLAEGKYIKGKEVQEFENQLAEYLKVKQVISCGNGTDALQIALMALGIGIGDEVIIPAFAYVAVIEVICLLGAIPVMVDIEPDHFQIDFNAIEKAITPKTKAIIPVHLFGQCGAMAEILTLAKKHHLFVIEDNAQALGSKVKTSQKEMFTGTIGDIGCTSFFPTKNLACFGDGGALMCNDETLAQKIRMVANHGQVQKYEHECVGVNSRLDTLQAAILNFKLPYLEESINKKRILAEIYRQELKSVSKIKLPEEKRDNWHTWHQFTLQIKDNSRDHLKKHLAQNGVDSMIYYPKALYQQKAYTDFKVFCQNTERICDSVLSLPIHVRLEKEEVLSICNLIKEFYDARA
ncbi:MAG: DegT/DnrJ/EryC1/StrS family aminotransferase [Sphingobacteriales bacterium]|nr:DegT/DnrJ/EryC1/StrS family aminotransferase [Sphingobacteriales bacterium]